MGALSYMSFWKERIFSTLVASKEFRQANFDVTIREIAEAANL